MEFSPTKNVVIASSTKLAHDITAGLQGLHSKTARVAKSLGGAISAGRVRNAKVLTARLQAFRVR
eukprot:1257108-Karenia_brevis.AAC.1